jgi:hypothetical protein
MGWTDSGGEAGYEASNIPDSERKTFMTKNGRAVRDGGGIEADVKVSSPKASVLEVTLLNQGAFFEFAGQWAKAHEYKASAAAALLISSHFSPDDLVLMWQGEGLSTADRLVTDQTYSDFKRFVYSKVDKGDLKLDLLFSSSLQPLDDAIKEIG